MKNYHNNITKKTYAKKTLWRQLGQSMAEYTVVMAALVGGLLVANKGACPNDYEDCIEYLLTVMHNGYDGYSSSISSVQRYATDYKPADNSGGWGSGDGDDGGSGSGGGGSSGGGPTVGLTQENSLTSEGGTITLGVYDVGTGLVTVDSEVVGSFNEETGTFTATDGSVTTNVRSQNEVKDEEGNILQRRAVTDCTTGEVLAFGYESQVDGKFYDSLQFSEMDIGDRCTETAYKVVTRDGSDDGGRIVNGFYYAVTVTPVIAGAPTEPEGEVVYWDFGNGAGVCAVMVNGWDEGVAEDPDVDQDDEEEVYAAQLALFNESDPSKSPYIGTQDVGHYAVQVFGNGEPAAENDCVSNRVISVP